MIVSKELGTSAEYGSSGKNGQPPESKVEEKRAALLSAISPLVYPPDLNEEFYIEFNAFKSNTSRADEVKRTFNFEKSVYLPFPQSVTDAYNAQYGQENLFGVAEFFREAIDSLITGDSGTKRVSDLLNKNLRADRGGRFAANKVNNLVNDPVGAAGAAATFLVNGVGGPIGAAAKTTFKVATNPYPVLIYQGTNFKSFTFSWTFFPESPDESKTINKIIGYFRREMLPERIDNHPSILKFPAIFEIYIRPDIKKFKRCVINSVDVNYTPAGPAFVRDAPQVAGVTANSNPAAISLTISLQEVEMWLANDFSAEESKEFGYTGI